MKRILLSFVIGVTALCVVTGNVEAATITGTPPTSTIPALNAGLGTGWITLMTNINTDVLSKYENQKDLAKGFANANIYSSQVATFQGYQNYSLFAVTTGVMLGVQAPSLDPSYYDKMGDELDEKGDLDAGVGAGIAFANIGINAGFIMEGLYLSVKFGSLKVKPDDEITLKNSVIGFGVNYGLIKGAGAGWGFVKWRGLSIGTGFIYHKSEVDVKIELDEESANTGYNGNYLIIDPSINLGLEVTTYTIPFDITTSIQLLWVLNLNLGAGIDFSFGKSDIIITSAGEVRVEGPDAGTVTPGYIVIDGSTRDVAPSFVRPRLMAGLGLNLWKVKIDVPVIYYPTAGFAVGLTAGVVW